MLRTCCCIWLWVFAFLNCSAQWEQVESIEGGTVVDLERVDNTIWAASYGGLFRSLDEGQTWVKDQSFPGSWGALDISLIGGELFVIIYESTPLAHDDYAIYLFRSRNEGIDWERIWIWEDYLYSDESYEVFRIEHSLFIIFGTNLFISEDDGKTWKDVNYFQNGYIGLPFALGHGGNSIMVTTHWGLYLSLDMGQTWDSLGPYYSDKMPILADSLFLVVGFDTLFRSTDLGQSWEQLPLPTSYFNGSIQRGASGRLYAIDYRVYVSEDDGTSWDTLNTDYYYSPVDLLEIDAGELLIATNRGFYVTSNDAAVWNESNNGFVAANIGVISISPTGEIFTTTNVGALRSTDTGHNWSTWELPNNDFIEHVRWISDDSAFLLTNRHNLFLATSGLQEYAEISPSGQPIEYMAFADGVLYVSTLFENMLLKSHDFGKTWNAIELPIENSLASFEAYGQVILVIESEKIWHSADGGETWALAAHIDFVGVLDSRIFDTGQGFLLTNRGQWFFSETAGATWKELNPLGLPDEMPEILSLLKIDSILFAVVPANGVYVSFSQGQYWEPFNEGLENLRGRTLAFFDGNLVLGTSHGSIWLRDISSTLSVASSGEVQQLTVYPMPVGDACQILLPESVHGISSLELYDVNGNRVYSSSLNCIHGHLHVTHVDLPAGFYIASLRFDQLKFVGKIVVASR